MKKLSRLLIVITIVVLAMSLLYSCNGNGNGVEHDWRDDEPVVGGWRAVPVAVGLLVLVLVVLAANSAVALRRRSPLLVRA